MGYALLPNFNDLFDYTKNEHCSEYIFDIEYETCINECSVFTVLFNVIFQGAGTGVVNELARLFGFPVDGIVNIAMIPVKSSNFEILLRNLYWAEDFTILVNKVR